MKKILLMLLLSTTAFADMEVERGYGNVEVVSRYSHISSNKKEFNFVEEMHSYIESQNIFLNKELQTVDFDKNEIIRPYFIGEQRKDYKNIGGGVLLLHSYDEGTHIGLQVEGRKISFKDKENNKEITTNRGTTRLLYSKQEENGNKLLLSPYFSFDNLKDIKNRSVGIYARQEFKLYLSKYNLIEDGLKGYIEIDTHRSSIKKNKENKIKNKNDSLNGGIGAIYSFENLEFGDLKINPRFNVGYKKEFLEKRKYQTLQINEDNVDTLRVGLSIDTEYKNILFSLEDSYEKSLNSKNYENRISGKITYKF